LNACGSAQDFFTKFDGLHQLDGAYAISLVVAGLAAAYSTAAVLLLITLIRLPWSLLSIGSER
jgi:hypothetical protein